MSFADAWLYPRLREIAPGDRREALRRAREVPFDVLELVGIAIGLIVATWVTRYDATGASGLQRVAAVAVDFIAALPLVALLVGPFMVRRVRRGLEREIGARAR